MCPRFPEELEIRRYIDSNAQSLMNLFCETVRRVNSADYNPVQIDAWVPAEEQVVERWAVRFFEKQPLVVLLGGEPVGFAELEPGGHIDAFYVHWSCQGKGVGSLLLHAVEAEAKRRNDFLLCAEVSITARPFFERKGFSVVQPQEVQKRGQFFLNYVMQKELV